MLTICIEHEDILKLKINQILKHFRIVYADNLIYNEKIIVKPKLFINLEKCYI